MEIGGIGTRHSSRPQREALSFNSPQKAGTAGPEFFGMFLIQDDEREERQEVVLLHHFVADLANPLGHLGGIVAHDDRASIKCVSDTVP